MGRDRGGNRGRKEGGRKEESEKERFNFLMHVHIVWHVSCTPLTDLPSLLRVGRGDKGTA